MAWGEGVSHTFLIPAHTHFRAKSIPNQKRWKVCTSSFKNPGYYTFFIYLYYTFIFTLNTSTFIHDLIHVSFAQLLFIQRMSWCFMLIL